MKHKYKLDTGLSEVIEQPKFETDAEAWEYLRVKFTHAKFATLYKQQEVEVKINNRAAFLRSYNAKYTSQIIDPNKPYMYKIWIPVLTGITSHKYTP